LFLRWCREWRMQLATLPGGDDTNEGKLARQQLLRLDMLAYTINDMIEARGFEKLFAAMTICLYDTKSGMARVCPIGDAKLCYFDAGERRMVVRKIPNAGPAAGMFSSEDVASRVGYPQIEQRLDPGDVLVLFTDGFEDSKRQFRDANGAIATCDSPGLKEHEDHLGTHEWKDDHERLTEGRILGIFEAFFRKEVYRLERNHLPAPETLEFDFSTCSDSLEEAVLALVSVERVYRTYRDPQTNDTDRITVEKKVEEYLRKHFKQYDKYFGNSKTETGSVEYIAIPNVKEDMQFDDLTVLLLRRTPSART
jgi:hypothetical protein